MAAIKLEFADEFFGPGTAEFNEFRCRLICIIGEVEELGVSDAGIGIVIHLQADDTTQGRPVNLRLHVLPVQESFEGIPAGMGHVQRSLAENDAFSFPLVAGLVENQEKKPAEGDGDAESGIYELQADASGQNHGRYNEVLCSMDLFEFDFHNYRLIKR